MNNIYYNQLVELLAYKPEGMKLCSIVKYIYNCNCSLFEDADLYRQIYSNVRWFLWSQSRRKDSPFVRVNGKWGMYGLKKNFMVQLELCFDNWEYDVIQPKPVRKKPEYEQQTLFEW